jgi:hypothetical protein
MGLLEAYAYDPYGTLRAQSDDPNNPPEVTTPTTPEVPVPDPGPEPRVIDPFAPKPTVPTPPVPKGNGANTDSGPPLGKPTFAFAPVPRFAAPKFTPPPVDMLNDPGYQFRLKSGEDALQRSAAAKGVLRTGGTLKDIIEYGQNFGANEYNNSFNRALAGFQANYQGAHDEYAPFLAEWQTKSQAEMAAALAAYQRQFDAYTFTHQYHAPVINIPPPPQAPEVGAFSSSGYSF